MNHEMASGAVQRLVEQLGESLFDQPGMTLTEQANRVRELRGDGPALLGPRGQGYAVVTDEMVDKAWHRFEAAMQASDGDAPEDRILSETIDQRDRYHEMADELAGHIARITGVDIGEHSSANCPWQNAIEAAEEYEPAQPSPDGQDALAALPLYRLADDAKGNRGLHRDDTGSWVKLQDVERALAARQPDAAIGGHAHEIEDPCDVITRAAQKLSAAGQPRIADRLVSARTEVERLQAAYLAAHQPVGHVPAGFVLVPEKFGIPADVWEGVEFVIGGPSTGEGEAYLDSTAWIGDLMQDDGSSIYGLHLSCDECPEEGCVTLAEFAPPTAQAVDLERFRPAVMTSLGLSSPNSTERETLRELLALIDSQAVGNG
ncbi:TPA: hypothetical protein QEL68_000376 [Stenotrophomonas maltophilia]|nr:hypothetical protein [Stenotrophomonas maltophilia]